MEALIAAKELKKGFGARTLFDSLHFSVHSGERIGLIGPNGAGKSTLLRLLSGEIEPDGGEVVPRRGLRIAYLQQTPVLTPTRSILETIQEDATDAPEPVALALELYSKVGLDSSGHPPETNVGSLSGGWQKRTALARELAKRPDLLLLDEPTNHLDIDGILWLEGWLRRAPFATVTVTHDRVFLQNVSNRILELDRRNPGGLLSVDGDYAKYLERKEQILDAQASREESLRNRLRRETEWLRRGAKARTTKQQARIHRANELGDEVADLTVRNQVSSVRLDFAGTERQTKRLIEAKLIAKGYGGRPLFTKLDAFLGPGTRLGLLGPNGCGKSTLIRLLLGHEPPDAGTIIRADLLRVSYFEQNRESLDPRSTVKTAVCPTGDHVKFQGRFLHVRSYLDRFLFAREQTDIPIAKLSGGEQARLLLARLMLEEADVLVLDEPTNDLDISTLDVLQGCLEEFGGAVILVSHDRYFLDQVSTELLAFTKDGVTKFADLAQWEAWRETVKAPAPAAAPAASEVPRKKRKLSYHESRELETIESRIHEAEARVADWNAKAEMAAADAGKLAEIFRELAAAQAEVERLFERWQQLEALKASLD